MNFLKTIREFVVFITLCWIGGMLLLLLVLRKIALRLFGI